MDIVALIISICAAAFAGVVACIAFREQRLRLRPYVYIGKANAAITDKALVINIGITNCGLLPAKITTISSELKFDGDVIKKLKPSATMHAIILPNQTIGDTFRLEEPARNMILQEKVKLTAKIEIRYQGNRQSHYFISTFVFNPQNKKLILVEADAN